MPYVDTDRGALTELPLPRLLQIVDLLGQAAFSRAVQALDLKSGALVCLKIIKVGVWGRQFSRVAGSPGDDNSLDLRGPVQTSCAPTVRLCRTTKTTSTRALTR